VSSPVAGQFKHLDKDAAKPRNVSEFRVDSTDGYEAGQTVDVTLFEAGELVDVIGTSKGKGFAGTIARHNFQRGPKTHGSPNDPLVHQGGVRQLAGTRIGTSAPPTRGDGAGGGRKPWRQKGTGRARQGSRRSPQWRGGGVVFGPHPRDHDQRMPAKMRRAALKGVLSAKQAAGELRVVEGFALDEIKTRALIEHLDAWGAQGKVLLVLAGRDETVERSCAN